MRIALIDLGTNSVLLQVLERDKNGEIEIVFQRKEMIQLGVGLFSSGDFTPEAKERALQAFDEFRAEIDSHEATSVKAVGTCAMREAASGKELRDAIEDRTGIALEIISGEEEARIISQGVLHALGPFEDKVLLVDIGGGSTEFSYVKDSSVLFAASTPIGAVRCQELLLKEIPAVPGGEEKLRNFVREHLDKEIPAAERQDTKRIKGSSGSIRAIARLIHGVESDLIPYSTDELSNFISSVRGFTKEQLLTYPGLEPKRATIIFAAAVILDEIASQLEIPTIEAVPPGLKDGLLLSV